jgi:hypothetical protein
LSRCIARTTPAAPGKGYAEKAAKWRGKLDETSKSQNVETSKTENGEAPK